MAISDYRDMLLDPLKRLSRRAGEDLRFRMSIPGKVYRAARDVARPGLEAAGFIGAPSAAPAPAPGAPAVNPAQLAAIDTTAKGYRNMLNVPAAANILQPSPVVAETQFNPQRHEPVAEAAPASPYNTMIPADMPPKPVGQWGVDTWGMPAAERKAIMERQQFAAGPGSIESKQRNPESPFNRAQAAQQLQAAQALAAAQMKNKVDVAQAEAGAGVAKATVQNEGEMARLRMQIDAGRATVAEQQKFQQAIEDRKAQLDQKRLDMEQGRMTADEKVATQRAIYGLAGDMAKYMDPRDVDAWLAKKTGAAPAATTETPAAGGGGDVGGAGTGEGEA